MITKETLDRLEYAKNATKSCLASATVSVDFHGLTYWAGEVERLRTEIKASL